MRRLFEAWPRGADVVAGGRAHARPDRPRRVLEPSDGEVDPVGGREDPKGALGAGMGPSACDEMRQARRCLNKALIMVAQEREIEKEWSAK